MSKISVPPIMFHLRFALVPLAAVAAIGVLLSCGPQEPPPVVEHMAAVDDETNLDDRHEVMPHLDTANWVERLKPNSSSAGYTLVLYRRRVPMLMDMQGRIVHVWPFVRGVGRARLDREGRLAVIGVDNVIKEYDWEGNLTWAYRLPDPDDLPHHDLIKLENGNYLILARRMSRLTAETEYLHEVDRDGRVVWEWRSIDHINQHFPDRDLNAADAVHLNSLFELGENRWFDAGDTRFKPGNLLISARNLNTIFIIEKESGEVVWMHGEGLDNQHEAQMVPKGLPGDGFIVYFNNGYQNIEAYRQSEVRVINPVDGEEVWAFSAPTFFSSVAGIQQILPNGNLLISSSEGGRVFEITSEKEMVWEWVPPFLPMRAERYPSDHCPQLDAMGAMDLSPVEREDRPPWVDSELGRYAIPNEYEAITLYGKRRQKLFETEGCRELFLPPHPMMQIAYGFDETKLSGAPPTAEFKLTVRDLEDDSIRTLVDSKVSSTEEKIYRDHYLSLEGLDLKRVEVCIDVWSGDGAEDDDLHPSVFMTNPRTYSQVRAMLTRKWDQERVTAQEQSLEERQLRALGYVQ